MNLATVQHKWRWCKVTFSVGLSFWIIETIFFLFKYGWHWSAFTEDERTCDKVVSGILSVALGLFGLVLIDVVEYLLSPSRKKQTL